MNTLQNIEAEQSLLGALLYRNDVLAVACDGLLPEHFSEGVHSRIYDAASTLIRAGHRADAITLKIAFEKDATLAEIGGTAYLARLAASTTSIVNAPTYAKLVRDLALRRAAMRLAEDALAEIPNLAVDQSSGEYVATLATELMKLGEGGQAKRTTHMAGDIAAAALDEAAAAYQNRGCRPDTISTGLAAVDNLIGGLARGSLTIAGGRPSMGKTALGLVLAYNAARGGKPVLFISLEMTGVQLGHRLLALVSGIPYWRIERGHFSEADYSQLVKARELIARLPLTIDDRDSMGAAELGALVARHGGVGLVVVDYVGLVSPSDRYRGRKVDELGELTAELKRLAKRHKVAVLALVQLNRALEARDNKRATLADLRDSGSIEQDADVVMFPYREEYYVFRALEAAIPGTAEELEARDRLRLVSGKLELAVAKNRQGPCGTAKLGCDISRNLIFAIEHQLAEAPA